MVTLNQQGMLPYLQPYLRNLLHYLDDINWPVFELVSQLIGEKFSNELLVPFREILIENDHLWKECYFIALLNFPRSTLDVLFPLIEHFAIYPKRIEMDEGIQQRAANIIFKRFSEKVIFFKKSEFKDVFENISVFSSKIKIYLNDFECIDVQNYKNLYKITMCHQKKQQNISLIYALISKEEIFLNIRIGMLPDLYPKVLDKSHINLIFEDLNLITNEHFFSDTKPPQQV